MIRSGQLDSEIGGRIDTSAFSCSTWASKNSLTAQRLHRVTGVTAACLDGLIGGLFKPIRVRFGVWVRGHTGVTRCGGSG
jgi:hypothetical protein